MHVADGSQGPDEEIHTKLHIVTALNTVGLLLSGFAPLVLLALVSVYPTDDQLFTATLAEVHEHQRLRRLLLDPWVGALSDAALMLASAALWWGWVQTAASAKWPAHGESGNEPSPDDPLGFRHLVMRGPTAQLARLWGRAPMPRVLLVCAPLVLCRVIVAPGFWFAGVAWAPSGYLVVYVATASVSALACVAASWAVTRKLANRLAQARCAVPTTF